MPDLILRNLGDGLIVLTLLTMLRRMKLSTAERFAVAECLRDLADELENRVLVQ